MKIENRLNQIKLILVPERSLLICQLGGSPKEDLNDCLCSVDKKNKIGESEKITTVPRASTEEFWKALWSNKTLHI